MISKTYYKYIWLLDLLLNSDTPLPFDIISSEWDLNPMADDTTLALRSFHEYRKGIKEMFGVEIVCDRKRNVYYIKNPEVLDENRLTKWLLRKYSIPKDFATFNGMKDRVKLNVDDKFVIGREVIVGEVGCGFLDVGSVPQHPQQPVVRRC